MVDTVTVIPIILAYTFIGLLFTILSFIAIYVSHKVYTTIFDRLPLDTIVANMPPPPKRKHSNGAEKDEKDQRTEQHISEKFVERYAAKRLQIVDVKRESRKVA